jgi:hypothetical protein
MMRLTGFLAGVGLTVAAVLLALHTLDDRQPDLLTAVNQDPGAEQLAAVVEAVTEQVDPLPSDKEPERSIEADVAQAEDESVEPVQPSPASGTADDEPEQDREASAPAQTDYTNGQTQAPPHDADNEEDIKIRAHLFWSPFRSEWAARGFARRLTESTEVPVEVIHMGPGNYRVAFNYQDESERLARIERIETVTGLQLEQ